MSIDLFKERLSNHFDQCRECTAVFFTLTKESEEGLFSIYKKKCYEQLTPILLPETPTLLEKRLSELTAELTELSELVGESQTQKCHQIVSHYFSAKNCPNTDFQ